jgi:hypothetical protein
LFFYFRSSEPDLFSFNVIAGLFVVIGNQVIYLFQRLFCSRSFIIVVSLCTNVDFNVSPSSDYWFIAAQGVLVLPIAYSLLTLGPSLISAPEVAS